MWKDKQPSRTGLGATLRMKGLPLLKHTSKADLYLQKFKSENFREPSSFSLRCSKKTVNERRLFNPQTGAEHLPRRSEKRTWPGSSCRGFLRGWEPSQVLRKKSQGGEGKGAGTLVQRKEVSGQGWPGKVKGGWGWSGTGGRGRTQEARRREASV